ncbi:MAG: ABC transporter permease subunit [Coriobacteriales bacterium]|jgi:ABC-type spermidine/putrescine transport system permease subunit II|nr:ABC transporter permease subunit [Coriobacteriales bacterium]
MSKTAHTVIIAIMLFAIVAPLVPLVLWSFAKAWPVTQIVPNFNLQSWSQALSDKQVGRAVTNSFTLSLTVVGISLALSFFAAKNLGTRRFKGRRLVQLLLLVPSFIPQISIVFGMQRVFAQVGLYSNFIGLVVALLVFYVPYMTLLLSAVFENYDLDYENQAMSLGVGRLNILFHVTLPMVRSGVIVTCVFGFIGTWSAYLITSAIAAPAFKTLPLLLFPMINGGTNGFGLTAAIVILYIAPVLLILAIFSKLLVNDTNRPKDGGLL